MPICSVLENGVAPPLLGRIMADLPIHWILKAAGKSTLSSFDNVTHVPETHVKYTSRVEIAVPASSAAESTSMFMSVYGLCGATNGRTIVFGPKRKISSANNILRQEADHGPRHIINSACGRYQADTGKHKTFSRVGQWGPGKQTG